MSTDQDDTRQKREVKLTEKGLVSFESFCDEHKKSIDKSWKPIEDTILRLSSCQNDIKALRELDSDLRFTYELYIKSVNEYFEYLRRTCSEAAKQKEKQLTEEFTKCKRIVEHTRCEIQTLRLELIENLSQISATSSEKRKRDERRREFLKKEADIQKEKLRIEAEELALQAETQRKTGVLEIDLKLLKLENADDIQEQDDLSLDLPVENKSDRTTSYVQNLLAPNDDHIHTGNLHEDLCITPVPNAIAPRPTPYRTINTSTIGKQHLN